jgi:hypothetical protein
MCHAKDKREKRARWDLVGTLEQCIAFQCSKYLKEVLAFMGLPNKSFFCGGGLGWEKHFFGLLVTALLVLPLGLIQFARKAF